MPDTDREREAARKLYSLAIQHNANAVPCHILDAMLRELETLAREVREQCAKAVCHACDPKRQREGMKCEEAKLQPDLCGNIHVKVNVFNEELRWRHKVTADNGNVWTIPCDAAAIRRGE